VGIRSVARAFSAVTADITDPVASMQLDHVVVRASDAGTAASAYGTQLRLHYDPSLPKILAGPCSVVLCWGGTAAVTGIATLTWAEVPAAWFEGY